MPAGGCHPLPMTAMGWARQGRRPGARRSRARRRARPPRRAVRRPAPGRRGGGSARGEPPPLVHGPVLKNTVGARWTPKRSPSRLASSVRLMELKPYSPNSSSPRSRRRGTFSCPDTSHHDLPDPIEAGRYHRGGCGYRGGFVGLGGLPTGRVSRRRGRVLGDVGREEPTEVCREEDGGHPGRGRGVVQRCASSVRLMESKPYFAELTVLVDLFDRHLELLGHDRAAACAPRPRFRVRRRGGCLRCGGGASCAPPLRGDVRPGGCEQSFAVAGQQEGVPGVARDGGGQGAQSAPGGQGASRRSRAAVRGLRVGRARMPPSAHSGQPTDTARLTEAAGGEVCAVLDVVSRNALAAAAAASGRRRRARPPEEKTTRCRGACPPWPRRGSPGRWSWAPGRRSGRRRIWWRGTRRGGPRRSARRGPGGRRRPRRSA